MSANDFMCDGLVFSPHMDEFDLIVSTPIGQQFRDSIDKRLEYGRTWPVRGRSIRFDTFESCQWSQLCQPEPARFACEQVTNP